MVTPVDNPKATKASARPTMESTLGIDLDYYGGKVTDRPTRYKGNTQSRVKTPLSYATTEITVEPCCPATNAVPKYNGCSTTG